MGIGASIDRQCNVKENSEIYVNDHGNLVYHSKCLLRWVIKKMALINSFGTMASHLEKK